MLNFGAGASIDGPLHQIAGDRFVTTEKPDKHFTLSEFAKAADVAKETIHYYLRMGILPKPRKLRERSNLYDENSLRLIRLVQLLQREKRLPLAHIAELFEQGDYDARQLELNLVSGLYESVAEGGGFLPGVQESQHVELVPEIEIPPEFQAHVAKLGIIGSISGPLRGDDKKIAGIVWAAAERGIPPEFFERIHAPIEQIVARELDLLLEALDGAAEFDPIARRASQIDQLITSYVEAAKLRQLRIHFDKSVERAPLSLARLRESMYIPSTDFLRKFHIEEQLLELAQEVSPSESGVARHLALIEALLIIGRYEESLEQSERLLQCSPRSADALINRALFLSLLGRTDEAVRGADEAREIAPENPRVLAYSAMVYLAQAARMGGVISPAKLLQRSLAAFKESMQLAPANLKEKVEVLLMNGRAFSVLPPQLDKLDQGIATLEQVLHLLDNTSDEEVGLPIRGANQIYRINTCFYLGEAYQLRRDSQAAQHAWQQVLIADPGSNFASYAYQKMETDPPR
jgi:tetratricopeptide (TPR) repeat protein